MEYYASMCRLCETTNKLEEKWLNLCSQENRQLLTKLRSCANVEICEDDKLPQRICDRCHYCLDQAYSFKLQCELTDAKLRHEIAFLEKNNWNNELKIPPLNNEAKVSDKAELPVRLDRVFVKVESTAPPEESDERNYDVFFGGSDEPEIELPLIPQVQVKEDNDEKDGKNVREKSTEHSGSDSESEFEAAIKKPSKRRKPYIIKNDDGTVRSVSCKVCNEIFSSERRMLKHALEVHGKSPYDCKVCGKNFTVKSHMRNHESLHSGVRQFECTECGKKYATHRALMQHMSYLHNENQPYVCDICGMKFAHVYTLRCHYARHIGEKKFTCEICSKGFRTRNNLTVHLNTHLPADQKKKAKSKPMVTAVCPYCGKVTSTVAMPGHIRTHTGEQPFQCDICLKRFASMQLHKKHSLIHSGEKPYVCEFCQKAFRQRHHMMTHIKGVHPNLKPYQCPMCPEAFPTPGSLRFHDRKAHPKLDDSAATTATVAAVPNPPSMDSYDTISNDVTDFGD